MTKQIPLGDNLNAQTPQLRAGIAKCDITSDVKSTFIKDPLYAKVLVLDDGKTKVVIIAMDVTAIGGRRVSQGILNDSSEDFLPKLRSRLQQELHMPASNVLVNASHTHPPGKLLCDDAQQIERTFDAVRRALEHTVPVKIGAGSAREDRITMNRTLRLKNGRHWTIRHSNPCPPDQEVAEVGPMDPEIAVLRIDQLDGRPLAAVYNFACHPLFGDIQGRITADFPAIASKIIEDNLGPGTMALFLQGAAGDSIDVNFKNFTQPRDITLFGTRLGLAVLNALREIQTQNAHLNVISQTIDFPRRTDIPDLIESLVLEQNELLQSLRFTCLNFKSFLPLYLQYVLNPDFPLDYSYRYLQAEKIRSNDFKAMDEVNRKNIEKYLKNIAAMEKLAKIQDEIATLKKHQAINQDAGTATIAAELQCIRIGDCVVIASPTELLAEEGLKIKKASPFKQTLIAAYSNGYMHYGPPSEDFAKGGYEVTECLLAPQWQPIFIQKLHQVLIKL